MLRECPEFTSGAGEFQFQGPTFLPVTRWGQDKSSRGRGNQDFFASHMGSPVPPPSDIIKFWTRPYLVKLKLQQTPLNVYLIQMNWTKYYCNMYLFQKENLQNELHKHKEVSAYIIYDIYVLTVLYHMACHICIIQHIHV